MNESLQTVVVVGNGMMSWRLCHELVNSGAIDELRVAVVGQEPLPAYDRVRLSTLLGGGRVEDILLAGADWYAGAGIDLHLGESVTEIDRDECLVRTSKGRVLLYDRLVLATGSQPFVPPIPGAERPGVFVYRTAADLAAISACATSCKRAVVLGGGLLGIEAAKAARDLGLEVTIVEHGPGLMHRQLDAQGSQRLGALLARMGFQVELAAQAAEITGDAVRCADGRTLPADLVILSAGIRPAADLARRAGLTLAGGAVAVDDKLQTSDDRIFAIGECAAHDGTIYGLVAPGYQMVRTLVANLGGARAAFKPQIPAAKLKLAGVQVASVGDVSKATPGTLGVRYETADAYRKLLVRGGRLVGALGVGDWAGFDRVAQAVRERRLVAPWEIWRFRNRGEIGGTTGEIVCTCMAVTRAQVEAAAAAGCEDVCKATSAGTMCGGCKPAVEAIVAAGALVRRAPARPERRRSGEQATGNRQQATGNAGVSRRTTLPPFRAVRASMPGMETPRRERALGMLALGALLVAAVVVFAPALVRSASALAPSVGDRLAVRAVKLWTGYGSLGFAALSLLLSLRKRWRRLRGDVKGWRVVHGAAGFGSAALVLLHTGLSLGAHLNFVLAVDYIAVLALGALAVFGRRLTRLHLGVMWPLPALLVLHVVTAYYY